MKTKKLLLFVVALGSLFTTSPLFAQGTAFTYQGRLFDAGSLANGNYDMQFYLRDALSGGNPVDGTNTIAPVAVSNGLFTVKLDFGAGVFTGSQRWLVIGVRTNGSVAAYTALTPRQELTPTPYAIFAESANAAGLTGTIPAGGLSGVSGIGLTGVALLAGGNNFTGNQFISGLLKTGNGSGVGYHADEIIGPGGYSSGEEHSINFDDIVGHVGSLIVGYNGTGYFSAGNLYYNGGHQTGTKAFTVFGNGNVNVDPDNLNDGFINSGNTNSSGLTFGSGSGEGIASKRTAGGNLYGLDFYTGFVNRMSIANNGNILITAPSQTIVFPATGGANSPMTAMFASGTGNADRMVIAHSLTYSDWGLQYQDVGDRFNFLGSGTPKVSINLGSSATPLVVNGEFAVVNGTGNEQAYMGGDGSGGDVQFGSLTSGLTSVAFYNATDNAYMHIYCSSITILGGADLAEPFQMTQAEQEIPQGAVVVIDENNPGRLKLSSEPYDTHVAGVVSGANGINPGIQLKQKDVLDGDKNVALTGRVYVQAEASNSVIKPGDLLTTSSIPGYAMKVTDHAKAQGAILGKAMTGLNEGKGMVLVLVTLQ